MRVMIISRRSKATRRGKAESVAAPASIGEMFESNDRSPRGDWPHYFERIRFLPKNNSRSLPAGKFDHNCNYLTASIWDAAANRQ